MSGQEEKNQNGFSVENLSFGDDILVRYTENEIASNSDLNDGELWKGKFISRTLYNSCILLGDDDCFYEVPNNRMILRLRYKEKKKSFFSKLFGG